MAAATKKGPINNKSSLPSRTNNKSDFKKKAHEVEKSKEHLGKRTPIAARKAKAKMLEPSSAVFKDMVHELENGRENLDGADQGAPWLKPWYWWSWPVLPLGLEWYEQRHQTLGYATEMAVLFIQSAIYIGLIVMTRLARPSHSKLYYWHFDNSGLLFKVSPPKESFRR
ncbi:hypothetical protein HN51_062420 [Arachis hypogaea]